ncbi:MAG TPA: deoxyribose-phosphate aldolase [Bacillota bacterium]|nr:deoxyribose-phosphate aldolase [Bacillota bacterium]
MNKTVATYIDHTLLKPDATTTEIEQLVAEAKQYQFASVCVQPSWVTLCHERLQDTPVKVCTVIGFPLGATSTAVKVFEANEAIDNGAQEVDMVIHIGALKSNDDDYVYQDIHRVVQAAQGKALTKVIIETALLTEEEKIRACRLAKKAGADFVKTSTGFSSGGATLEDVRLMRETVGSKMGVKASGGIRDARDAKAFIEAGATRIGASAGVDIVEGR